MKIEGPKERRELRTIELTADIVVVGGGLAGVCAAITAARAGQRVCLIQDRPVLGGNASSEIRMWGVGATSHMGNNNRWSREGGVIGEILVENLFRNVTGNSLIFDAILLDKVVAEPNLRLLLNTAVFEVGKSDPDTLRNVRGFNSQNGTIYVVAARQFIDASGDGIVGFMAGAAFRMGAESKHEFDENFAPTREYGELLGHTLYFYSKDTGRPVQFIPPDFALKDITEIPRWRNFNAGQSGCQLWWIEYGGRLDTVHDTEEIKWKLWTIIYGLWDHIKNSGQFPEARNLTLEWVGTVPGKRESRRFEGDYMLSQRDIVEQREHADAISYGGWAIDLHPADGIFSEMPGCNQWHSKGIYQIPYRCMYSRNLNNLFLGGRLISASHVAFGSTRVMLTCAHNAQVAGMAAAICNEHNLHARELAVGKNLAELRQRLDQIGHFIPRRITRDQADISSQAKISASSEFQLDELAPNGDFISLETPRAMLVPIAAGPVPKFKFRVLAECATELKFELRASSRTDSFTPDLTLAEKTVDFRTPLPNFSGQRQRNRSENQGGTQVATSQKATSDPVPWKGRWVEVDFDHVADTNSYLMVCLMENPQVSVALSDQRMSGVLSLSRKMNGRVSTQIRQTPPPDIGIESFEFWLPTRRPDGKNLAMQLDPPLVGFTADQVAQGPERPTSAANAWIARLDDRQPSLHFEWTEKRTVKKIVFGLDTDFDHGMETLMTEHPENRIPFCVSSISIFDENGTLVARRTDNHETRPSFEFSNLATRRLKIEFTARDPRIPVSVFRVRIY